MHICSTFWICLRQAVDCGDMRRTTHTKHTHYKKKTKGSKKQKRRFCSWVTWVSNPFQAVTFHIIKYMSELIRIGSLQAFFFFLVQFCFVSSQVPVRVKWILFILHLPDYLSIHPRADECSTGPSKKTIAVPFGDITDTVVWKIKWQQQRAWYLQPKEKQIQGQGISCDEII